MVHQLCLPQPNLGRGQLVLATTHFDIDQHRPMTTKDSDRHRAHLPVAITGHSPVQPPFVCTLTTQTNTTTRSNPSVSPVTIQALVVAIQRDGQQAAPFGIEPQ